MMRRSILNWSCGLALLGGAAVAAAQMPPAPPPPPIPDEVTVTTVREQPPPMREEKVVETTRPGPTYIWIPGAWDYRSGNWTWVAGHWDMPPAAEVRWIAPEYAAVEQGVRYTPGHWTTTKVITDENGKKTIVKEKVKVKEK